MKNHISIFLAVLIIVLSAALSGCGGSDEPATITIPTVQETTAPDYTDENGIGYNEKSDGTLEVKTSSENTDIVIPETFKDKKVTSIGKRAFKMSGVTSVVIPDGVKEIKDYAFSFCKDLQSVTIPDTVKKIGMNAFSGCINLSEIRLPKSLKSIGLFAFDATAVIDIIIPAKVKTIEEYAFGECPNLQTVTFEGEKVNIAENAFEVGKGIVIRAKKGSDAQKYAKKRVLKFEAIK